MKEEFVKLAMQPNANRRELIRRFKISPKTAYKWINRYEKGGLTALADQSRRPKSSPPRHRRSLRRKSFVFGKSILHGELEN